MVTLEGQNGTYTFDPQNPATRLGQGGMGVVFRGEEVDSGRAVAVKVLYRELTATASHVERARREAAIQMKHENLLEMLDFVELGGIYHSISEYLEGETLARRLDALRPTGQILSFDEVKRIIDALLGALEALHQHQPRIVHRDVDPSNLMLCTDGRVKLMDFGVVKLSDGTRKSLTSIGAIIGKPHYSAPEQIRNRPGDEVDESTDLYAAGITAYELLTGEVPFDAPNEYDLMQLQMQRPLPRHPHLSRAAFQFLQNATAKDQRHRYRNAAQMRRDFARLPSGPVAPLHRAVWQRRPVQVAAVTLPLLAALGGLFYQNHRTKMADYQALCLRAEGLRTEAKFDSAALVFGRALAVHETDSIRFRKKMMENLPVAIARLDAKRFNEAYWRFAADTTDASAREAFYYLGEMTRLGQGTQLNVPRANDLFRRAAQRGYGLAKKRLGDAYVAGDGVPTDFAQAVAWYEQAVRSTDARPTALYGLYYVYSSGGNGLLRDYPRSLGYLKAGAWGGSKFARYYLGLKYRDGEAAIPRNLDSARYWLGLSAQAGYAEASKRLAELNSVNSFTNNGLSLFKTRPKPPAKVRHRSGSSFWDRLFGPPRRPHSKR